MKRSNRRPTKRRGITVAVTAVSMTMVVGFAALAIDIGYAYSVKAELQRAADAAALAGASAYITDDSFFDDYDPISDIIARVEAYALDNPAGGLEIELPQDDIIIGRLNDPSDAYEVIDPISPPFNAVQVTARRDPNRNGEISLFFASIFGYDKMALRASSTAIAEDQFSSYHPPPAGQPGPLLPFTIEINKYELELATGPDLWRWDSAGEQPENNSDGISEIWIYPAAVIAGNFGTLNIGVGNQGTTQLGGQIANGLTEVDLLDEIGTDHLSFLDEDGNEESYTITGNPGISGGLVSYIESRVGDVVGFFIHDSVTEQGSNFEYNIVSIRFGRLMEVDLTGSPANKRMVIQPVVYTGPGIQTDPGATSTGGMIYALRLIR